MPEPNSVSPGVGRVDLSAAPGADADWDSLFPNPELQPAQVQLAQGTPPPQTTSQATQPFLKAGETVYNTAEDAINGTVHKDNLIANYRKFLTDNGIDPNTMQKITTTGVVTSTQSQAEPAKNSPYKYYGNPNFFDEVAAAANAHDKARYEQLMAQHTREAIAATLDPWRATLANTNRFNAIRQVSTEIPNFQQFIEGPEYKKILDSFPLYKEMAQIGENDPVAAQRLPEVYKSLYLIYQGMNKDQAQAQSQTTTSTTQVTPTVRQQPTLQPSSLTPPPPGVSTQGWQESNWNRNKTGINEARKQLIQDGDNRFKGLRFEDVNL